MGVTIGLVANVFNESNALPGWLETHLPFFDDVRVMHAGPRGEKSTDGTIELLEKWHIPVEFCAIDEGFGAVRTRTLRLSPCDYVMLLDADERFYPVHQYLQCDGEGTSGEERDAILRTYDFRDLSKMASNWENISRLGANLKVYRRETYNQGLYLKDLLTNWSHYTSAPIDAVASIRRHWHDVSLTMPTQDWRMEPDWQVRIVRNHPSICFDSGTRMHERMVGADHIFRADMVSGPFFDHFHFHFKRMEQVQRAHDVDTYDRLHSGKTPRTYSQFLIEKE